MCKKEYINLQTKEVLDLEKVSALPDNAMLKVKPELWVAWDSNRNDELDIFKMTKADKRKAWWLCSKCNSEYHSVIYSRVKGSGCPYCRNLKVNHTNCLATKNPKLASEWHPTLNNKSTKEVPYGSSKKVWWLGECGHEWEARINKRISGQGCPYCVHNPKVKIGFNDINTTHPEIAKHVLNEYDKYKYSKCSDAKIDWKCLECDNIIKSRAVKDAVKRGISCPLCNDGFKKPEKIMIALLNHLNVEFKHQKTFEWSDGKVYDFYIENDNDGKSYIIETHGSQHYKQAGGTYGKNKTLAEEQENDKYKFEMAMSNGIDTYIVIDCRNSDFEYIKNSILKSELLNALSDNTVDWKDVFDKSKTSKIVEACNLYSKGQMTSSDIARELKISINSVIRYLKDGNAIGLCNYNATNSEDRKLGARKISKKVVQLTINGDYINSFNSIMEASRSTGIHNTSIGSCCRGKWLSAGGYRWMSEKDYNNIKESNLEIPKYERKQYRKVVQLSMDYEYINSFDNMAEASKAIGICATSIWSTCKGKRPHAKGYKWMYKEDYEKLNNKTS